MNLSILYFRNWRFIFLPIFLSLVVLVQGVSTASTSAADSNRRVYLVGAGIASLASAVYFIQDGHIPGDNIYIFEQSNMLGGSLDASGNPSTGYLLRGGRMFTEEAYAATFDLLAKVPSLNNPQLTLKDEFDAFNHTFQSNSKARLVDKNRNIVDATRLGLSWYDTGVLTELMLLPESLMCNKKISDYFSKDFFESNFWKMWSTTFAFQPWHSAIEMKRYQLRFIDEVSRLYNLGGIKRSPFNQYDSFVRPIVKWLEDQGVHIILNRKVVDFDFAPSSSNRYQKSINRVHFTDKTVSNSTTDVFTDGFVDVAEDDLVLTTLGSMVEASDNGDMDRPARLLSKKDGGAWTLWENIASKADNEEFGRPQVFDERIAESKWLSFTVTIHDKDKRFFKFMKNFSGNNAGTGGLVTFKDSSWLMSIILPKQPYFINQPDDVQVIWGYGLFVDKKGDYIDKTMAESTGRDILRELMGHLRLDPKMMENAICKPVMMPFITSQFLTRSRGDRPAVVPKIAHNFAFMGQFTEIPHDTVFTVDYSIRSAQIAVYSLLKLDNKVTPIHYGQYDPKILLKAIATLLFNYTTTVRDMPSDSDI
ncbi:MAG: oleate hydratase [Oligoflexia bacterium]|nr:oleate hydratase [Oligoflexia bacterium]